eukprot:2184882-Rhodomonas_salina.3
MGAARRCVPPQHFSHTPVSPTPTGTSRPRHVSSCELQEISARERRSSTRICSASDGVRDRIEGERCVRPSGCFARVTGELLIEAGRMCRVLSAVGS